MNQSEQAPVIIFGAGKIARGYIGHLVALAQMPLCFVDVNEQLVQRLNDRGRYTVHILGNPAKSIQVTTLVALHSEDPRVADVLAKAALAFVSVGGPNLPAVAATLAAGIQARRAAGARTLNIICCENWHRPAEVLRQQLEERLAASPDDRAYLASRIGIAEATVLRSCIEPTDEQRAADPLAIQAQDYWELQIDAAALVEALPPIPGLKPLTNFHAALERKLFTYNAGNATIAYLGAQRGHKFLYEAATDPMILEVARGVYQEAGVAICARYGYSAEEQTAYAQQSLRKYQDPKILDPVERNVRDPLRKLGRHDRLIGPACLALEYGIRPYHLALAIAAALKYTNAQDPSAVRLQQMIAEEGLDAVLEKVCGIEPDGVLARLVKERRPDVAAFAQH
jgi:mannitol-1-phosphate 5-dehydrogenase